MTTLTYVQVLTFPVVLGIHLFVRDKIATNTMALHLSTAQVHQLLISSGRSLYLIRLVLIVLI